MIERKTPEQLRRMREAGLIVAEGLAAMSRAALPGMTTAEIDEVGREVLARHDAKSNFLGYGAEYGLPFPGVACISVNEILVHGVPNERVLREGDVVSIDFGAVVDGWHGDAACTVIVGEGDPADAKLSRVAEEALWAGIRHMAHGRKVSAVSRAIEHAILAEGRYGILREYTGHGIGSTMHMDPDVPNFHRLGPSPVLLAGMVLAIEPMITRGTHKTRELDDGWSVVSRDGSRGAHWEHSVALTDDGLWVLTAVDGGAARLGDLYGPLGD